MNELWLKSQAFEDYFLLRLAEEAALAKRGAEPQGAQGAFARLPALSRHA